MNENDKRNDRDEERSGQVRVEEAAPRRSLTERVSYAWGRWLSVPPNPENEFVLA